MVPPVRLHGDGSVQTGNDVGQPERLASSERLPAVTVGVFCRRLVVFAISNSVLLFVISLRVSDPVTKPEVEPGCETVTGGGAGGV
jgi:hypothetical protein